MDSRRRIALVAGLLLVVAGLAAGIAVLNRDEPAAPGPGGSPPSGQASPPGAPGAGAPGAGTPGAGQNPPGSSGQVPAPPEGPVVAPGTPAPDFTLRELEGRPVSLSNFRGKVVFLNFWASWCYPCRQEMPEIRKLVDRMPDDVVVVGVTTSDPASPDEIKAYVEENGYDWVFVYDEGSRVGRQYRIVYLPTSYFIDPDGVVRARHIGPMTAEQMERYIQQARPGGDS
ncbi:TlpA family protein disulfide reductase [Thermaerobacter litoralis]